MPTGTGTQPPDNDQEPPQGNEQPGQIADELPGLPDLPDMQTLVMPTPARLAEMRARREESARRHLEIAQRLRTGASGTLLSIRQGESIVEEFRTRYQAMGTRRRSAKDEEEFALLEELLPSVLSSLASMRATYRGAIDEAVEHERAARWLLSGTEREQQ